MSNLPHSMTVANVNYALPLAIDWLLVVGRRQVSRNGPVLVAPGPVMTTYLHPTQRVLLNSVRRANPFFHLAEALWMLAGRDDVAFLSKFNSKIANYSDDGETFHGAYGERWHAYAQLDRALSILRKDPFSRRVVVQIWEQGMDLGSASKDIPCNNLIYFAIDQSTGNLDMTVCNRSNDVIWGAYGANVVHFSMLQEFMAASLGVPVGAYTQFSNNFHIYTETYPDGTLHEIAMCDDWTRKPYPPIVPLYDKQITPAVLMQDCERFCHDNYLDYSYESRLIRDVACPMRQAWELRKIDMSAALDIVENQMPDCDWREACLMYLRK